jgi:two-component system phosphate regulon sensor histidine kinase PhoR
MARIGKYELWQICSVLALVSLFAATTSIALGWPGWMPGLFAGTTLAWACVALAGFVSTGIASDTALKPVGQPATASIKPDQRPTELNELVEAIGDPVIAISPEGVVLLANSRASSLLGNSMPMTGRHVEEVVTKAELLDRLSLGRQGERWRGSVRLPTHDGVKVCEVSIVPLSTQSPAGVVATIRDITELDGALQLKTDFVANASHELRTPIAAIKGAAETLTLASDDEIMRNKLVGMIEAHVIRLENMVSDLLDLSKLESESMAIESKPVSLTDLAAELTQLLYELSKARNVEIEFDIDPATETICTDKRLLVLIIKNLIENGAKFTAEGTAVSVKAIRIAGTDSCQIRVQDRGPGIPLSQQQRIFERFYQVDPSRSGAQRGTGLGLAIVKHAVRLLDSEIDVESVWHQGTTMVVTLPGVLIEDNSV